MNFKQRRKEFVKKNVSISLTLEDIYKLNELSKFKNETKNKIMSNAINNMWRDTKMVKLDERVMDEIAKIVDTVGFLEDSDNVHTIESLCKTYFGEIDDLDVWVWSITQKIKEKYNHIGGLDKSGNYISIYSYHKFLNLKEFYTLFNIGK